jgi:hypothetical protein
VTAALRIELLGDGGIRVEPPAAAGGLASGRMAHEWIEDAARRGYPVEITGDTAAPAHASLISDARATVAGLTVTTTTPAPWNDGLTSLQMAANSGLAEQAGELAARYPNVSPRRGAKSPYRLAMQHGHIDTLVALRNAGITPPAGSRPPDTLPNAVVLRNYLPSFVNWVAIACAIVGIALAVAVQHWAFLIVAAVGFVTIAAANLVIGLTRVAVDGRLLAVRQIARWQGPVDVGDLVALGYAPAGSRRMSGRWRFVQTVAGPPYGRSAYRGFEPALADRLKQRDDLRVVTVYVGRGFLSPGFQRHLVGFVLPSEALVSDGARRVFDRLTTQPANPGG